MINLILPSRIGEWDSRRNAVVVSSVARNLSGYVRLCPISDSITTRLVSPSAVVVRGVRTITGVILCSVAYEVFLTERYARLVGRLPEAVRAEVLLKLFPYPIADGDDDS